MRLYRISTTQACWLVAVMTAALGVWFVLSPSWAARSLAAEVRDRLGYEFEARGGASLQFTPSLAIRLDGARLAPTDIPDAPLIADATLTIPVSPIHFITRTLAVEEIGLEGPSIAFLVDERGRANWTGTVRDGETPIRFHIENAAIRYFDARNSQALSVTGAGLAGEFSGDGALTFSGTAVLNGRLAKVEAYLKSADRVHEDGSPFSLSIMAPEITALLEGRLSTTKILNVAGTASLSVADLRAMAAWAEAPQGGSSGFRDFRASGAADVVGRVLALRNAAFQIDGVDGEGEVTIDLRGAVPKLQAVASLPRLAVETYVAQTRGKTSVWSPQLLGFEALKNIDIKATVVTQALSWSKAKLGPAAIDIRLEAGKLKAELAPKLAKGGTASIKIAVDAAATPPDFAMELSARDVESSDILPFVGIAQVQGKGMIHASLRGSGRSQQDIIGSLEGKATLALADGELKGIDIEKTLGEVSQRIVKGWPKDGAGTPFASLQTTCAIKDGIADVRSARIESGTFYATVTGEADLLREALDLTADPRLKVSNGATAGLPVTISVEGPWQKPRFYPDMPDILKNPAKAFEKLKSEGLQQIAPASGN